MTTLLLDRDLIAEIKRVGHATGRHDLHAVFVRKLEESLADFPATFSGLSRRRHRAAVRAAHTLKGSCRQIGAHALGDLFADIERSAKAGDYAAAKRMFEERQRARRAVARRAEAGLVRNFRQRAHARGCAARDLVPEPHESHAKQGEGPLRACAGSDTSGDI
jgi:HPt (histidine-containing phosphotransfer) domain-containing protein